MSREPARPADRRARSATLAALVVVSIALTGVVGYQALTASSSTASLPRPHDGRHDRATAIVDGDDPAVANLDPDLLQALRRAAAVAASDGVTIDVTSGWRSRKDQERLFQEAVSKYGSSEEAARWVAVPGTSAHESGNAVDVGPSDAAAWLFEHGASDGLCRTYGNEAWHFELRPDAVDHGCPAMYADPTQDPRMQQ